MRFGSCFFGALAWFLASHGLHGNNQISGEAQDVLWKLEECKVRIADQPPRTRSAAPDLPVLKASLATPGWNKGFGSRHVRGDYKTVARL